VTLVGEILQKRREGDRVMSKYLGGDTTSRGIEFSDAASINELPVYGV
jgi:hypothetical protein